MKKLVLYIHGKGGSAEESRHYEALFPGCDVMGLDYQSSAPWEAGEEIRQALDKLKETYPFIILIANSIGAYFCMQAGIEDMVRKAYFISPLVDMERLILDMMEGARVTEEDLEEKGVIASPFGEDLSWDYLCWVRAHPVRWNVPTEILCGGRDSLTSRETITGFAGDIGAGLTVMEDGEHWFHTREQMLFLDRWIRERRYRISSERLTPEEYIAFLKRTDLGSQYPRERFRKRIAILVESVSISLTARDEEGLLVGVLFGLTDFSYWLYLTDLGVDRLFVRQGIGRRLIRTAHELAGGEKDIAVYLITNEKAVPFYERIGMRKADDVMQYNHIEWTEFKNKSKDSR